MFRPDRGGGGGHSGSRGSSGGNGPNGGDDGHLACRHYLRELRGQLVAERQRRLEAEEATSVLVAEICSSLLTELEKVKKQARGLQFDALFILYICKPISHFSFDVIDMFFMP